MSEDAHKPAVPEALKRSAVPKSIVVGAVAVLAVLIVLLLTTRLGVLTPQGRLLIEAQTDGLQVGRIGELHMEGLSGDVLRDFRVRRLTISDEEGVWLEARNVHLVWTYTALLRRNFNADLVEAEQVRVLRRPTLRPKGKDRGLPVSFHIDQLRGRLEMLPAFSFRHGVYDVRGALDIERRGGQSGELRAESVLHPGDFLDVEFAIGGEGPVRLRADAREARGGALAGALGLASDQPFVMQVRADGQMARGRFTAIARSGETTPLTAQGAWTPQGGQAGGRLQLDASTLLAPYVARFGPEVRFGVAGRETAGELHALEGRLYADNLILKASGRGNIGERRLGPQGLRLDVSTPSLSRVAGGGTLGPGRVVGVLRGEGESWRFAGGLAAADVGLGGYGLNRVAGPVEAELARGALTVEGRLAGAGGRGSGYLAAILGGAPEADFAVARERDGRLLLRDLDVTGRGLRLQASGGRSLLGALTFKGRADISNLAAARPGAAGGRDVTWSAQQARAGRPWTVTLDSRGQRFASGFAQLDRLLGASPRLRAQANWQAGRLSVSRATLDGAALDASAAGVLRADRTLAFKGDWNADGPFRAGPVEISGAAEGTAAVTGPLGQPRLDVIANVEEIDVPRLRLVDAKVTLSFMRRPDGSSGLIAVTADSAYGVAQGRSAFRFPRGGVDLTDLAVNAGGVKASGALSLRRRSPSAADLEIEITRGALLDEGRIAGEVRIVDAGGGARADIALRAQNAKPVGSALTIRAGELTAQGPMSRLPYVAQARGASRRGEWVLDGRGLLSDVDPGYALTFDGEGRLGDRNLRTVETASFRFGGGGPRVARLRLASSDGGRIDLDAALQGEAADVEARVTSLGLVLLDQDLAGRVDATLTLQGRGARLTGTLNARLADARGRGSPAAEGIDGALTARLADETLTLDASTRNEQGLRATANIVLPTEASAAPFRLAIVRQRPMRGRFAAEGEVRPLWDLLVGGDRTLAGHVQAQGTLGGTLADPTANGQIAVDRGRFDDGSTGLSLREVVLRAAFTDDGVNVTEARGVDGAGGSLAGSGRISLLRDGVSSFRLNLDGFQLIDNELAEASATGQATISRAADGQVKITGNLSIDEAEVAAKPPTPSGVVTMDVVEINRPPELSTGLPPTRSGGGWLLDVNLTAPRRVFLRGRGLDVELSLDAHVGGTTGRPNLSGTARVVRGDYEFAGKRFEFDTRSVVYLSTRPEAIRLQLDAVREDPTLTVTIRIRGTAARPEITLTSSPALPNDEILSQVLFGRSASQLSAVEAAQLASAISSMTGGGGLDLIGNLRTFAGLDRLAFGGGDEAGLTVAGGKYLTDDVYIEIIGGGREGGAVQVEWRVRRNLSILSRLGGQGDNRLAVRWRRDY